MPAVRIPKPARLAQAQVKAFPARANGGKAPAPKRGKRKGAKAAATGTDPELRLQRDRLLEKFTIMQADLGGAFYEMAVRDHVRMDVLTRRAAELQRVDLELAEIEQALKLDRGDPGACPECGAPHDPGARFCSQCAHDLGEEAKAG
jgi:RNA polymerase-binding transcription factor DksA